MSIVLGSLFPGIDPTGTARWGTIARLFRWQATPWTGLGLWLQSPSDNDRREPGSGVDAPGQNLGLGLEVEF